MQLSVLNHFYVELCGSMLLSERHHHFSPESSSQCKGRGWGVAQLLGITAKNTNIS